MLSSTFVDELGYLSLDQQTSNLLYQVISTRHGEKRSTIITTNTAFSDWGNILYNTTIATAIADRLVELRFNCCRDVGFELVAGDVSCSGDIREALAVRELRAQLSLRHAEYLGRGVEDRKQPTAHQGSATPRVLFNLVCLLSGDAPVGDGRVEHLVERCFALLLQL